MVSNNEGMQILVTNRAVEFGQKVYTDVSIPKNAQERWVQDWKLHSIRMKRKMRLPDSEETRWKPTSHRRMHDARLQARTARRGRQGHSVSSYRKTRARWRRCSKGCHPVCHRPVHLWVVWECPPGQMPPMPPQGGPIGATGLNQQMPPNMMRAGHATIPSPEARGVGMRTPRGPAAPPTPNDRRLRLSDFLSSTTRSTTVSTRTK